jgi:hypothetical protein
MPTLREVVDVFEGLESGLGFIQFNYVPQLPKKKACPSSIAAAADTRYSRAGQADPSLVRAYVPAGGRHERDYWIYENQKNQQLLVRLRPMDRLCEGNGTLKETTGEPMEEGKYVWRSYRVGGIKLDTVHAVIGGAKARLFPNAPAGFRRGV